MMDAPQISVLPDPSSRGTISSGETKRVCHPFHCRLPPDSDFPKYDPQSLVGTGFFSLAICIFTTFRLTPPLLLILIDRIRSLEPTPGFFQLYSPILICIWLLMLFLALFAGGLIMVCSRRIQKRTVLLFHPWALLLLYIDGFFWLFLTVYLHLNVSDTWPSTKKSYIEEIPYPVACFTAIYTDIILFMLIHFAYASYYITAEITVIENCF